MITVIFGALSALCILVLSFARAKADLSVFLNPEGILIVLGGTIAILFMGTQKEELERLLQLMLRSIFPSKEKQNLKATLLRCTDQILLGKIPAPTAHPYLNKCVEWYGAGLRGNALETLMIDGAKLELERGQQAIALVNNLSKYPPALGMVGTVFGIIAVFQGLSQAEGQKSLGTNLAFAMTATLYGLITSNFIISPLGEFLTQATSRDETNLMMILETVKLWSDQESKFFIEEKLELFHVA